MFTVHYVYIEISIFIPVSFIRIVLSSFYLLTYAVSLERDPKFLQCLHGRRENRPSGYSAIKIKNSLSYVIFEGTLFLEEIKFKGTKFLKIS